MKKRRLLFATKVAGGSYICVKVAEKRKAVRGSMSLRATCRLARSYLLIRYGGLDGSGGLKNGTMSETEQSMSSLRLVGLEVEQD